MKNKQFDENKYKRGWQKENMAQVTVKYKNEFVEEFKQACNKLGITQSMIIRKAMEDTIMEAEKIIIKYAVETGYYNKVNEDGIVYDFEPCGDMNLYSTEEEARKAFNDERIPQNKGYVELSLLRLNVEAGKDIDYLRTVDYDFIVDTESLDIKTEETV